MATCQQTEYFLTEVPMRELVIATVRSTWRTPFVNPQQRVWISSALAGLLILTLPRCSTSLRKYWPALLLGFAIVWLKWSDVPGVGVVFFIAAAAGAIWVVRLWEHQNGFALPSTVYETKVPAVDSPSGAPR
jgi:hypothetical protein